MVVTRRQYNNQESTIINNKYFQIVIHHKIVND